MLAGGERRYEVEIPAESCKVVREVEVRVAGPRDPLGAKLPTPNLCAP